MSDSPALANPAGTGLHIRHTFPPVFLADGGSAPTPPPLPPTPVATDT